jgi:hypothetical protein
MKSLVSSVDFSTLSYNWVYVIGGLSVGLGIIGRHLIHKAIEEHIKELKEYFEPMANRLNRIEYALYNDGQTGLINKVDDLLENQQQIKIDVEVMKSKVDND